VQRANLAGREPHCPFGGVHGHVRVHGLLCEATVNGLRIVGPCPDVAVNRSALKSALAVAARPKISIGLFAKVEPIMLKPMGAPLWLYQWQTMANSPANHSHDLVYAYFALRLKAVGLTSSS